MKDDELGIVYSDSEVIFKEGEQGDRMYVIQSGKVKIIKKSGTGDMTIATLHSGEIFGEMALFDRMPRSATAAALGQATILGIDKKKLFSTISRDPTLAFKILETMSQRIRKVNEECAKLKKTQFDILHAGIDSDEICRLILEEAKNIIKADNGSVMLFDDEGKHLIIKSAFGSESEPKMRLSVGKGIAGDVLRTGMAELINNVSMESRFVSGGVHIKSLLCVPLRCESNSFGVINMSNSSEKLFTLDDLKLLHSLAIHAGIAIRCSKNLCNLQRATNEVIRRVTIMDM